MAEKTFHSITLPGQDTARVPLTAAEFSTSVAYKVKDYCTYQGKLYRCTTAHAAGVWNAAHFTATDIDAEFDRKLDIPASQASAPANPRVGDLWIDNDENSPIYNVDASPTLNSTNAVQSGGTKVALNSLDSRKMEHGVITGDFSASVDYRVGDLVFYATTANGITTRTLYRCITDHNSAAWNAAHFTATTLEVELQRVRDSEADTDMIGDLFGAKSTYAVGDYCVYNDNLYRCIQAVDNTGVTTPAFDPDDWTQVALANEVSDLKSAISDLVYNYSDTSIWVQGAISSDNGTNTSSTTRIRTRAYIDSTVVVIEPKSGYKMIVAVYDNSNVYKGMWDGTSLANKAYWFEKAVRVKELPYPNVRLVFADTANGTIVPSDAVNCLFVGTTDKSLTIQGKSADAKAVGDSIYQLSDSVVKTRNRLSSSDDLNDITTNGIYDYLTGAGPLNVPFNRDGIIVVNTISNKTEQFVYSKSSSKYNSIARRIKTSTGWCEWETETSPAFKTRTILTSTDDLNNITTTGVYEYLGASRPINAPNINTGAVIVYNIGNTVYQVYYNNKESFFRVKGASGTWYEWINGSHDEYVRTALDGVLNARNLYNPKIKPSRYYLNINGIISTVATGDAPNSFVFQVKPNTKYRISTKARTHKRAGTVDFIVQSGRTTSVFVKQDNATSEDIIIQTSETNHWLVAQLFTTADDVTLEDLTSTLIVAEVTAQDNIARDETICNQIDTLSLTWESGTISPSAGIDQNSSFQSRTVEFIDSFDLPETFAYIGPKKYYQNYESDIIVGVYEYAADQKGAAYFLRRMLISNNNYIYHRSPDCLYVRFIIGVPSASGVAFINNDAYSLFELAAIDQSSIIDSIIPKMSWRLANVMARMRQMASIGYVPVGTIPNQSADMQAGTFYHGVPYSSVRALDTYVGINISLDTFATMLKNPKSVIYTRMSTNTNSKTYVGTVCSAFVDYLYGLNFQYNTNQMVDLPEFTEHDFWQIETGDILVNATHAIIIANVEKDKYSRVIEIGVTQAAPPRVYYRTYTPDALKTFIENNGYGIYSYVGLADYGYEPSKYVKGYPDEVLDLTYPDIMSEWGDKAAVAAGSDVTINVLNASGYTAINVYKDDVLVDTKTTIEDFTMENIAYGDWKFELVGDGISSETMLTAVDMQCEYDTNTHIVTFSSANARPFAINNYGARSDVSKTVKLTEADVTRGTYDCSDIVTATFPYIRVAFEVDCGRTAWRSHDLHLWREVQN